MAMLRTTLEILMPAALVTVIAPCSASTAPGTMKPKERNGNHGTTETHLPTEQKAAKQQQHDL